MAKQLFSATVFFKPGTLKPRKYRNISLKSNFERNMRNKGAYYVNYYDQETKSFVQRIWLQNFPGNR